jgi:RNA-directed DNA polymerase
VAQMVVKQLIEPDLDPIFLADSCGYRPRKSAIDAIGVTRKRCWKYDWVLEFDIKGLFDNIDHELLLRAVRKHVRCKWALLYIERWLTAPMDKDGIIIERTRGCPTFSCTTLSTSGWDGRTLTSHGVGMQTMV